MNSNTRSAIVTQIPFGHQSIEGLQFTDTTNIEFGVSVVQICEQFQILIKNASRDIKALLGKDFQFLKTKTSLNPKAVNVVHLKDYEKIVFRLALKGKKEAIEFSESLIGLSLHQLFCDAFRIKCETEERQNWLTVRQSTKDTFKELTAQLQESGFTEDWEYGKYIKEMQDKLDIKKGTRDLQERERLLLLDQTQLRLATMIKYGGITPWQALNEI